MDVCIEEDSNFIYKIITEEFIEMILLIMRERFKRFINIVKIGVFNGG